MYTALRTRCGTPGYLAPELLGLLPRKYVAGEVEVFTHALDMWSLGCMVHELLTLKPAFCDALTPEEPTVIESGFTDSSSGLEVDMGILYPYCQGAADFPTEILRSSLVEDAGINFIKSLLAAAPGDRATATLAQHDPWLADTGYVSEWYTT